MTTKHSGFRCIFIFDEPEVIRNQNSSWHEKYRVIESSPTLPIYVSKDNPEAPTFPTRREFFGLVEFLPDETFSNYKQRVIDILRTQSHCRRMWRHFNDAPIPSVFKQSELFGDRASIDVPALCPTSQSPDADPPSAVKTNIDAISSSTLMHSNIDLLHIGEYSRTFPLNPLRIFHLLPKPDEPPLSEFYNGYIPAQSGLPNKTGVGTPMEVFCPTTTLKQDAQSFPTYTSSFFPPPQPLRNPFVPLRWDTRYDTPNHRNARQYIQPLGHSSFPFYSPFAVHSALPIPYSSPLEPITNSSSGNHCLVSHNQERLPDFEGGILGSVKSCDDIHPNTLCSDLLNKHSSDSTPLLLFLVPAQLHLYPIHTEVTTADKIVLDGMSQQHPTLSLPHSQAVDDADLFNSVAGVLTQGRRIVSQNVFSATEDWHYVLDKLNSIIRPSIEMVQEDYTVPKDEKEEQDPEREIDPREPIVTVDRMTGMGIDVRAFVTGSTFKALTNLGRRPTIADLLIGSSSHLGKYANADSKAQLIPRLLPPSDQKQKYLQLLRVAVHLNHVAPASGQTFTRLTAASLLPQFSSHFDIPLHSLDTPHFTDFIRRFIDFILTTLLVEVKTLAELADPENSDEIVVRLTNAMQPVFEPTLLTVTPKPGAITEFRQSMIFAKPTTVEGLLQPPDQVHVKTSTWEGTEEQSDVMTLSAEDVKLLNRNAEAINREKEKEEEEIERRRQAKQNLIEHREPEGWDDGPKLDISDDLTASQSTPEMTEDQHKPVQQDITSSLESASITPDLQPKPTTTPKKVLRRKKRPPTIPSSGNNSTQLDNESDFSIALSAHSEEVNESKSALAQLAGNSRPAKNDEVVERDDGNVYHNEQTDGCVYGDAMERQDNADVQPAHWTHSVFQTKVIPVTSTTVTPDRLTSKSQLDLLTTHRQNVSYLQLFEPVLMDLITLLEKKGVALSKQNHLFPVSQISDETISLLNDHVIAGRFVFAELKPRSRLFAPAISETHFHSLDRIIKKLINTFPVLNVLTLHMQILCNGHNLDDVNSVSGIHYSYGHLMIKEHNPWPSGLTMHFFTYDSFSNFILLAQSHFGFYDWGCYKCPGTTDGEYRGVEEITLECGDVTQLHQPSDVVGLESVRGLFVVGDIHGNLNAALCCCDVIDVIVRQPPGQAAIVFCGDYIDRGPFSFEVLTLLLVYRMRFPKHVFLIHGNHESSLLTYEQTKTIDKNTAQTFFWNDFFHEKFPAKKHKTHPFTRLLLDLFKAMPSAVLCTLRHTSIQTETPIAETRRVLCLHGGLSSIFPIPNLQQIINHPPIMDDIYAPSGLTAQQLEQWSKRTQQYSFNYAASVADPYAADEPWKGRSRFSPITTRAFMAANRIDLILRGHQCPIYAEGSAESHDGSIITTFGAFDYFVNTTPPYDGTIPDELGERINPSLIQLKRTDKVQSTNGAMQWLCLQSVTSRIVDPVVLVKNAQSLAPSLARSSKDEQEDTTLLRTQALTEHINTPTAGFTFDPLTNIAETSDEKLLKTEETRTSAIIFTMKTIHLDSLAKLVRSAA